MSWLIEFPLLKGFAAPPIIQKLEKFWIDGRNGLPLPFLFNFFSCARRNERKEKKAAQQQPASRANNFISFHFFNNWRNWKEIEVDWLLFAAVCLCFASLFIPLSFHSQYAKGPPKQRNDNWLIPPILKSGNQINLSFSLRGPATNPQFINTFHLIPINSIKFQSFCWISAWRLILL